MPACLQLRGRALARLKKVNMHIGEGGFPVLLGYNKLGALFAELKKLDADQVFLGYDENSFEHCAPQIEAELDAQGINFFHCVMGVTESAKVPRDSCAPPSSLVVWPSVERRPQQESKQTST